VCTSRRWLPIHQVVQATIEVTPVETARQRRAVAPVFLIG
jgi:hypothetical protein